jgi:MFS family permease
LPTEEIERKIEAYQLEHLNVRNKPGSFSDLFRLSNMRKNIIIMSFLWLTCSYCFYGLAYYIGYLTGDVYINVMACGCVCLCGCLVAIPLIKKFNRKPVIIFCNLSTSLCLLAIATVPRGNFSLIFGILGVLFSYMVFVVVYLYCSEMFPTIVRNAALGISSMMARFGSMIAPFVVDLKKYGNWCAPVAFGILPIIAAVSCVFLPETKDSELIMTIEEGEVLGKPQFRQTQRIAVVETTE